MAKQIFIGDDEKADVKEELVNAKNQIRDNLTPVAQGGNWPDLSGLPQTGQDALEILRQNDLIFMKALIYLYKRVNALDRQLNEPK